MPNDNFKLSMGTGEKVNFLEQLSDMSEVSFHVMLCNHHKKRIKRILI